MDPTANSEPGGVSESRELLKGIMNTKTPCRALLLTQADLFAKAHHDPGNTLGGRHSESPDRRSSPAGATKPGRSHSDDHQCKPGLACRHARPGFKRHCEDEEFFAMCTTRCFRQLAACLRADVTGHSAGKVHSDVAQIKLRIQVADDGTSESHRSQDHPQSQVSTMLFRHFDCTS